LRSAKLYNFLNATAETSRFFQECVDFVQVSFSATVRLNTIWEPLESVSTQK